MKALIVFQLILVVAGAAHGRDLSCIPRTEMGETVTGEQFYERDKELQIKNLSHINLDKLTITSAEGKTSKIVKVENNLYKTVGSGAPYYFLTNEAETIVTELSVQDAGAYVKVLLCK